MGILESLMSTQIFTFKANLPGLIEKIRLHEINKHFKSFVSLRVVRVWWEVIALLTFSFSCCMKTDRCHNNGNIHRSSLVSLAVSCVTSEDKSLAASELF